ncbi:uncharacterized protein LOC104682564 isoform X3 [Rhinopithecus roxellana]|nr:uncharacterized protein LOC104682564 isoform X3 [Rhinopithecus roxellana]
MAKEESTLKSNPRPCPIRYFRGGAGRGARMCRRFFSLLRRRRCSWSRQPAGFSLSWTLQGSAACAGLEGPRHSRPPAFRALTHSRLLRVRLGGARAAGRERAASAAILEKASVGCAWARAGLPRSRRRVARRE